MECAAHHSSFNVTAPVVYRVVEDRRRGRGPAQGPQSRCTRGDPPPREPPNLRPVRRKQYLLQNRVEIPMLILSSDPTPKLAHHMEAISRASAR